ncbi:hypothetical protein LOTGIDRAFT_165964 [Lottia gigantea]|uniref:Uncharacterized protein n=1 Tax=Lottia gigantea TaxID=225164 RepID=V4BHC2_LOTGI|nr:hypothetical protein LOTGIDRAFT_165964 [Lottia gigantea]ESO87944.1 hypothetical protein LOTGIDRAFT_165964 [Lottia gigantea]
MKPNDGPPVSVRVDPAPEFTPLVSDQTLLKLGISLEVGRIKIPDKNPVAERAIQELEDELYYVRNMVMILLHHWELRVNSRIRSNGLSAHELWVQRSQVTNQSLIVNSTVAKVGDLVYLTCDGSKDNWFYICKFVGAQLRSKTYQVHPSKCIVIPQFYSPIPPRRSYRNDSGEVSEYEDMDCDIPFTDADQM